MSVELHGFSALMALIADGDQQAAAQCFHQYKNDVLRVIGFRLRCHKRIRSRLDAEDVAQDVWMAFFNGAAPRQCFATPTDFLKYIAGMARHQVDKAAQKHFGAQKRDLRRIHYLSDPDTAAAAGAVADPHLAPDQLMASQEACDQWLTSLAVEEQQVISMIRDCFTHQEIAAKVGRSERSIERIVARFRDNIPTMNIPN